MGSITAILRLRTIAGLATGGASAIVRTAGAYTLYWRC